MEAPHALFCVISCCSYFQSDTICNTDLAKNDQKYFQNITLTHQDHKEYFRIITAVITYEKRWRFRTF